MKRSGMMRCRPGIVHPVHEGMIQSLGLELDQRGNVKADTRLCELQRRGIRRRPTYRGPLQRGKAHYGRGLVQIQGERNVRQQEPENDRNDQL
jgi:hypothetical protein